MPGMFSEVATGGGFDEATGSGVGLAYGAAYGAASFAADASGWTRLPIKSSPPTPAAAAVTAVTPAAPRNLRRSMAVVIVSSCGAGRAGPVLTRGPARLGPRRWRSRR